MLAISDNIYLFIIIGAFIGGYFLASHQFKKERELYQKNFERDKATYISFYDTYKNNLENRYKIGEIIQNTIYKTEGEMPTIARCLIIGNAIVANGGTDNIEESVKFYIKTGR